MNILLQKENVISENPISLGEQGYKSIDTQENKSELLSLTLTETD